MQVINAELIRKVEKLSSFCMKYFENLILLLEELILNNEWISSGNNNPIIEYLELLVSEGWNLKNHKSKNQFGPNLFTSTIIKKYFTCRKLWKIWLTVKDRKYFDKI